MNTNTLPVEIVDYIWSFDNTKYNRLNNCIERIKFFNHAFEIIKNIFKSCINNSYYNYNYNSINTSRWWLSEYGDKPGKFILKKIREYNKFQSALKK